MAKLAVTQLEFPTGIPWFSAQCLPMSKRCLSCNAPLAHRTPSPYSGDFCSEFCFSAHPSTSHSQGPSPWGSVPEPSRTERILQRNRQILLDFKHAGSTSPRMCDVGQLEWLRRKGFDFEHHTRLHRSSDGGTEIWCYDTGYRIDEQGRIAPL